MLRFSLIVISFFCLGINLSQKKINVSIQLFYYQTYGVSINDKEVKKVFHPKAGNWDHQLNRPYFLKSYFVDADNHDFFLLSYVEEPLTLNELKCIQTNSVIESSYQINTIYTEQNGKGIIILKGCAIRKSRIGKYFKLISLTGEINISSSNTVPLKSGFVLSSVLSSGGSWYKIGVTNDGIYKLDYHTLLSSNIINGEISSDNINIYGNGQGLLNSINGSLRYDDLILNRTYIYDGGDGLFSPGDYVLFYAMGPDKLSFNGTDFSHTNHVYCDSSYYFVNIGGSDLPHRVGTSITTSSPTTHLVNEFTDFNFFEEDRINLLKSGAEWYGDVFDVQTTYIYDFSFPNLAVDSANVYLRLIGKSPVSSTNFIISSSGQSLSMAVSSSGTGFYSAAGKVSSGKFAFLPSSSDQIQLQVTYNKNGSSTSKGYLDYIEISARRMLVVEEKDMKFSDPTSIGAGNVAEFQLSNASGLDMIWEITDPYNASLVNYTLNISTAEFKVNYDSLRTFVAISGNSFPSPDIIGAVNAQDLHGLGYSDMIIISPQQFFTAAQDLKLHHESEGLDVHLVTPEQIYNEFSSGMRDATAIKQFLRMFYVRSSGDPNLMPKYCLLFGECTYDNKNILGHGNNKLPAYESNESLSVTSTYVSDDYFAILFDGGSIQNTDLLNIAVGRIPVNTLEDAQQMVQKIKNYSVSQGGEIATCSNGESSSVLRDWRNIVAMVSDDEDNNAYFNDIEIMADKIEQFHPEMNIVKMHSDAYAQESTPVGERIPGVSEAIKQRVEKGALLLNYIGHGGEAGWAHEQILTIPTIQDWSNYNRLPVFMTATCEFSRFDDHDRISAGEYVLLNPDGGGIGLCSTTRLVYATPNEWLNRYFYDTVFDKVNDLPQRFGDIYVGTKNKFAITNGDQNYRKFALLGDPALRLALPLYRVVTDSINGIQINVFNDTINALSSVRITGHVEDLSGQKLTSFNGVVFNTVYDKISSLTTLGSNSGSTADSYNMWKNVIYKGKSTIANGEFFFEFIVPKDISFQYGNARLSYYAENGSEDANGYDESIIIGGINSNAIADELGPDIQLFMNDDNFVSGGLTDDHPSLYAKIYDENGVNTVGNGIGHNIEAYLDNNTSESVILNDYYESDLNTYKSGQISYPFSDLEDGHHTLTLKVWDVYNNSSTAEIEFVVANNEDITLSHVLNYPNPFTTYTEFFFEHNQICDYLDVQVQIFTISGKLVKTINNRVHGEGYRSEGISWNARDDFGDKLALGVYVYTLQVTNERGEHVEKTEKLVILN